MNTLLRECIDSGQVSAAQVEAHRAENELNLVCAAKPCGHHAFDARVRVARLEDSGRFMAEVRIHCVDCGRPFQFLGLAAGVDLDGARVSIDGLEANIAICPQGARPNPLQGLIYGVERFAA